MSEDKVDGRVQHIKDRISSGFPKLGNKLDKLFDTEETRYVIQIFVCFPCTKIISFTFNYSTHSERLSKFSWITRSRDA